MPHRSSENNCLRDGQKIRPHLVQVKSTMLLSVVLLTILCLSEAGSPASVIAG